VRKKQYSGFIILFVTIILLIALFSFSKKATADKIKITPDEYTLSLTAGDKLQKELIINWQGDQIVKATIQTKILPDGEGINISFSDKPIFLQPGQNKITMFINTSVALTPEQYIIKTTVTVTETIQKNKDDNNNNQRNSKKQNYVPNEETKDETGDIIEKNSTEINESEDENNKNNFENPTPENTDSENKSTNETIKNKKIQKQVINRFILWTTGAIIFVLILFMFLFLMERRKRKNEK